MSNLINHSHGTSVVKVKPVNGRCLAKKITDVLPSNSWAGQTCFILGGGPSLEGFDYRQIVGFHTIGINKTFQSFSVEVNYAMDYNFFDLVQYNNVNPRDPEYKLHQEWLAYSGIKLFIRHDHTYRFCEGIYFVDEITRKEICFDLNVGLYPGNNSGMGALMLAVALGCKRIGLLGYDFKVQGSKTHWHSGYANQDKKSFVVNLDKFRTCIEEFAPTILEMGIEVVNLSSDSSLQIFPKSSIKTFLSF